MIVTGAIFGCWDLFHKGHLRILQRASYYCHELYVIIYSDKVVEKLKNRKPIIPEKDREEIIKGLRLNCVHYVCIIDEPIKRDWKFDYLFVSEQLKGKKLKVIDKNKFSGKIVYLSYTKGISTSKIIHKILFE